jgi:hypothetical protein
VAQPTPKLAELAYLASAFSTTLQFSLISCGSPLRLIP